MLKQFIKDMGGKIVLETSQGEAWMFWDDEQQAWFVNGRTPKDGIRVWHYKSLIRSLMLLHDWAWGKFEEGIGEDLNL